MTCHGGVTSHSFSHVWHLIRDLVQAPPVRIDQPSPAPHLGLLFVERSPGRAHSSTTSNRRASTRPGCPHLSSFRTPCRKRSRRKPQASFSEAGSSGGWCSLCR